jgi:hypothetical protein
MKAKGPGQSVLLLLDVINILDRLRIPYAVVGAFAASFYGVVRASMDADAVISLQPGQAALKALTEGLLRAGLKSTYRKGGVDDPVGAVINVEDNFNNRVDLLMNIQGVTEDVFSRTIEAEFMNARIQLVGIEDFIAMKIFARSPKDLNVVVGVLNVSYDRIHMALLRKLVQRYGKKALDKLESLLKEHKP